MSEQQPVNEVQAILAEQELALSEIDKQFHQTTFIERMKILFNGLSADKASREYKLARIELQRLSAPAIAVAMPFLLVGGVAIFASQQPDTKIVYETIMEDTKEITPLEKIKEEKKERPEEFMEATFDFDFPDMPTQDNQPDLDTVTAAPAAVDTVLNVRSPVVMRNIYGADRGTGSRGKALGAYRKGDAKPGETSVELALRWLKKNQNEDGSWPNCKPAMTGLALLCYLARGIIPGNDDPEGLEFGETVQKAMQYLCNSYDYNSRKFYGSDGHEYAFPIAVYALSESYGMTRVPSIKVVVEDALKRMIEGQHASGGWDYNMNRSTDRDDTSYMGWCAQALKAAKLANMFADDSEWAARLEAACKRSNNGFLKNGAQGGGFGYTEPGKGGLTGVGTLCMQFHGMAGHKQVIDSLYLMDAWKPGWHADSAAANTPGNCIQYYFYYATQAKFHAGNPRWDSWDKVMNPAYVAAQKVEREAYPDHTGKLRDIGWWANADAHTDDGARNKPVMDTCLAALQLMVYYRYLPTNKETAVRIDDEIKNAIATEKGDVRVDVGL